MVSGKSKYKSKQDFPDFNSDYIPRVNPDFYQIWCPNSFFQTLEDFALERGLLESEIDKHWNALYEVIPADYEEECNEQHGYYYRQSFIDNLIPLWKEDNIVMYDFIKQPRSFILVVQQDYYYDTDGLEGELGIDVGKLYYSRYYRQYVCPVQKRWTVRL